MSLQKGGALFNGDGKLPLSAGGRPGMDPQQPVPVNRLHLYLIELYSLAKSGSGVVEGVVVGGEVPPLLLQSGSTPRKEDQKQNRNEPLFSHHPFDRNEPFRSPWPPFHPT